MPVMRANGSPDIDHTLKPIKLSDGSKSVEIAGFIFTGAVCRPALVLKPHYHDLTRIALVIKGSLMETIGRSARECNPSDVIIRPAGEIHSNRYSRSQVRWLFIDVKPERVEFIRQASSVLDRTAHFPPGPISVLGLRIYEELQAMDSVSPLSIEALTLEMLVQATRFSSESLKPPEPRWLRRARDHLHDQFPQKVSLGQLAESAGVHPAHLAKTFRKHYHCTIGDYVRRLQLAYAVQELSRSNGSIAEIAAAAGFYDQSHLTQAFKQHLGTTPAQYRAALRQK